MDDRPFSSPAAITYDTARGVAVLFGGASGPLGEIWEWSGTSKQGWVPRPTKGPAPIQGGTHALAYHAARAVTLLFGGGTSETGRNGDTWEWNGDAWTQRLVSGPSPRWFHAMAYDSAREVVVLFGGSTGNPAPTVSNQTWEWDGTAWTQRLVSGPSARFNHAMAYDAARGVTVLFGGATNGGAALNAETWEWDGVAWVQRAVTGPLAPAGSCDGVWTRRGASRFSMAARPALTTSVDTWEWNGAAWTQRMISGPPAMRGQGMTYDTTHDAVILFGEGTWLLGSGCACAADFNCDGLATSSDFFEFLAVFFDGGAAADFNDDGNTDSQDFFDFLDAFFKRMLTDFPTPPPSGGGGGGAVRTNWHCRADTAGLRG